jgi:hypothetical protein
MTDGTQGASTPKTAVNATCSEEVFPVATDETIKCFNDGDIVEGIVVKVGRDEVLLDIGWRTVGVIPARELSIEHHVSPHDVVGIGERIEALVLQKEDKEGRLILSKKRARYERGWDTIEKVKEADGAVAGTVVEVVEEGLILDIGVPGFLPASLVEMRPVGDLQPYLGKDLEAKILELNPMRFQVVLSRRAWLEQIQMEGVTRRELGDQGHGAVGTAGHPPERGDSAGTLSNRELVGRGLELLAGGLGPFVQARMAAAYPTDPDWTSVIAARDTLRPGGRERRYFPSDPRLLLRVVTEERGTFKNHLSYAERRFAAELRETGNRWAHGEVFSADDTYRALDTMERLLVAVNAAEQAMQNHRIIRAGFPSAL